MAGVSLHPIDPLRGPLVITVANDTTWTSQPWSNLTHSGCTVYISSDQAIILRIDHASGTPDLASAPVSSMHSVAAYVPVSFHVKLDGRVSQVRVINSSGMSANVTVDVLLRPPTAEDHASMRLTMEGLDIGYGNPLPVSGTISNAVEVSQWDANSLNATVVQAGTVNISSASALDCSAATVTTQGLEMQVATVLSPGDTADYPIVGACRVYGVYFAHGSTNEQNLALYDATSGVVPATATKFSIMTAAGDLALVLPGGGYVSFANGVGLRSTTTQDPASTTGSSSDTMALIFYRAV